MQTYENNEHLNGRGLVGQLDYDMASIPQFYIFLSLMKHLCILHLLLWRPYFLQLCHQSLNFNLKLVQNIFKAIAAIGILKFIFNWQTTDWMLAFFRFQRRDCRVQEHQLHSVGRRWSGQDPSTLASLFPKHAGSYLRGWLKRQGKNRGSQVRIASLLHSKKQISSKL